MFLGRRRSKDIIIIYSTVPLLFAFDFKHAFDEKGEKYVIK
jgi:hypothetical protein